LLSRLDLFDIRGSDAGLVRLLRELHEGVRVFHMVLFAASAPGNVRRSHAVQLDGKRFHASPSPNDEAGYSPKCPAGSPLSAVSLLANMSSSNGIARGATAAPARERHDG
jgi:hypothetical protein